MPIKWCTFLLIQLKDANNSSKSISLSSKKTKEKTAPRNAFTF